MTMNKKKLPKAIRHTVDDPYQTRLAAETDTPREPPASVSEAKGAAVRAAMAPQRADADKMRQVEPTHLEVQSAKRKSRARAIVERHATYSGVGGVIPLPIVNIASVTAVIVRMVKMLSDLYGVPFERDRARAIVVGLMGGAMPTGLAAATASTLVYVIPGSNLIGLAVSSVAAIACTRSIGRIFIEHFESGATLADFQRAEAA
jgi:uncharacterized protein (DUF697 family)